MIINFFCVVKDNLRQQYASANKNYIAKIWKIKLMKRVAGGGGGDVFF